MTTEEFDAFCEDVQQRGIIYPISLYEGKVLDGWHRYRAAIRTGTQVKTVTYEGKDPAGYIASCNIHRRKLSSLQRALFAARVHLRNGIPQSVICKRYSISNTVLSMVLKAIDSRNAAILKRIETDSDYTRGMLREELEERGLVHANYGRSAAPKEEDDVFVPAESTPPEKTMPAKGTPNSIFQAAAQVDNDLTGGPMPEKGKKNGHPERRAKDTPAQALQERWKALMADEKATFLTMIWAEASVIAVSAGLSLPAKKPVKLKAVA
jgi:hypothetical protein